MCDMVTFGSRERKRRSILSERTRQDNNDDQTEELEDGIIPGLDMQLGDDPDISGGDDLAELDEENLYGNDVLVDSDEIPGE